MYGCTLMFLVEMGEGSSWFPLAVSPIISYLSCLEAALFLLGVPQQYTSSCSDTRDTPKFNSKYQSVVAALLPVEILSSWPSVALQKSMAC